MGLRRWRPTQRGSRRFGRIITRLLQRYAPRAFGSPFVALKSQLLWPGRPVRAKRPMCAQRAFFFCLRQVKQPLLDLVKHCLCLFLDSVEVGEIGRVHKGEALIANPPRQETGREDEGTVAK